jgi:hypothetical protein
VWLLLDFKITEIFGYKEDAILGSWKTTWN